MIRRFAPWFGPLCALGLLLFCYGSVLFRGEQYGYRDAAHYYYPLYQRVQTEWAAGHVPLWDVSENAGMPLLGNPTAAVLYPGKLIFAVFSYPWAVRLYTVAHTVLAFAGMWVLVRGWQASWTAATLAGLSFAFGAPVLFQYCNIIYLVGAAWIPWGFWAVDRWLRLHRGSGVLALAVVLAMQVLGGDPESAYLIGLCAGGYALLLVRADRPARPSTARRGRIVALVVVGLVAWVSLSLLAALWAPGFRAYKGESLWGPFGRWIATGRLPRFDPDRYRGPVPGLVWSGLIAPLVLLGWSLVALITLNRWRRTGSRWVPVVPMLAGLLGSAALAGMLAAVQLLPVTEFTGISARATAEGPHDIYPFSLEPYRAVELVWPGFFGRNFGGSVAWMGSLLPSINHRIWVPSLYLGGLTWIFAIAAIRRSAETETERSPWRVWLILIALVATIASFGEFASPIWVARFLPGMDGWIGPHDSPKANAVRLDGWLRDGDGSPYSLMATFLPGFHSFRYPSKLFTFVSLALAGLAGLGWDRITRQPARGARRCALVGSIVSLGTILVVLVSRSRLIGWFEARKIMTLFGPLDASAAVVDLLLALGQGGGLCLLALGLMTLARRRPEVAGGLAVVLMTLDLGWANESIIRSVPQRDFEDTPTILTEIARAEQADPSPGPYRIHRMPIWNPPSQHEQGSTDRIRDFDRWERNTIQPKYGINHGVEFTKTIGVAELYDYDWFFSPFPRSAVAETARSLGISPGDQIVVYPRRGFDLWGSRYFILPYVPRWDDADRGFASFLPNTHRIYPPLDSFRGPDGTEAQQRWAREQDVQIYRNKDVYPRAWVVHDVRFKPTVGGLNRAERDGTMEEILFSNDPTWRDSTRTLFDPKVLAWIETDDQTSLAGFVTRGTPTAHETVTVAAQTSDRVVLDATLDRPGLVILADVFYPGWTLTIDGKPAPIFRANRLMRGAAVQAGRHQLVYTYQPASFRQGAAISLVGLLILAGGSGWLVRKRGRG